MPASARAVINPELIVWARESAGMDSEEAAKRLRMEVAKVRSWEDGTARPTVKQLRKFAAICRQSFAAFYLPEPPEVFRPPLRDFRRLPGSKSGEFSSEIWLDVRKSMDRRKICLELYAEQNGKPPVLSAQTTFEERPEEVANMVRGLLGMDIGEQKSWRDKRVAFNSWREAIENAGALVFQSTRVELSDMRGYSIAEFPLPAIVVNRKDAYAGRTFTMLHEMVHLMSRTSGVCDLDARTDRPPEEQKAEVFCNRVAGAALVPEQDLLDEPAVRAHRGQSWDHEELASLSGLYGVSNEVILRRLLTLGLTNAGFYRSKRAQYLREYGARKSRGFMSPSTDLISAAGKPYVRLVLSTYDAGHITASDVADYLAVRLKHLDKIREAMGIK